MQDVAEELDGVEELRELPPTSVCWLYALKLAVVEGMKPGQVVHLPAVLFHRFRNGADDVSLQSHFRRLAEKHLARHRPDVVLTEAALVPGKTESVRVRYPLPSTAPLVSIDQFWTMPM